MRIYRQAETFALAADASYGHGGNGLPYSNAIQFDEDEQLKRKQLGEELQRRVDQGQIQPLDATSPQSVTDANQAYSDLFYDPNDGMVRRPA